MIFAGTERDMRGNFLSIVIAGSSLLFLRYYILDRNYTGGIKVIK